MNAPSDNLDPEELARFEALASRWWDRDGEFKALHDINPLRLDYVSSRAPLTGRRVLDVGCGGGILTEAMARKGARVLGIDLGEGALAAARAHARQTGVQVDYRHIAVEPLAAEMPGAFELITCMELLEHVPAPDAMVAACARLLCPGGDVFFSTLNRNPKSYLLAVVAAEYALGLLPRGTHDYAKFIKPSELDGWARGCGLEIQDLTGMHYHPTGQRYTLGGNVDVNYLVHYRRPGGNAQ